MKFQVKVWAKGQEYEWRDCKTAARLASGWLHYVMPDGSNGLAKPANWRVKPKQHHAVAAHGFTLIELLVVGCIVICIAAITIPALMRVYEARQQEKASQQTYYENEARTAEVKATLANQSVKAEFEPEHTVIDGSTADTEITTPVTKDTTLAVVGADSGLQLLSACCSGPNDGGMWLLRVGCSGPDDTRDEVFRTSMEQIGYSRVDRPWNYGFAFRVPHSKWSISNGVLCVTGPTGKKLIMSGDWTLKEE